MQSLHVRVRNAIAGGGGAGGHQGYRNSLVLAAIPVFIASGGFCMQTPQPQGLGGYRNWNAISSFGLLLARAQSITRISESLQCNIMNAVEDSGELKLR